MLSGIDGTINALSLRDEILRWIFTLLVLIEIISVVTILNAVHLANSTIVCSLNLQIEYSEFLEGSDKLLCVLPFDIRRWPWQKTKLLHDTNAEYGTDLIFTQRAAKSQLYSSMNKLVVSDRRLENAVDMNSASWRSDKNTSFQTILSSSHSSNRPKYGGIFNGKGNGDTNSNSNSTVAKMISSSKDNGEVKDKRFSQPKNGFVTTKCKDSGSSSKAGNRTHPQGDFMTGLTVQLPVARRDRSSSSVRSCETQDENAFFIDITDTVNFNSKDETDGSKNKKEKLHSPSHIESTATLKEVPMLANSTISSDASVASKVIKHAHLNVTQPLVALAYPHDRPSRPAGTSSSFVTGSLQMPTLQHSLSPLLLGDTNQSAVIQRDSVGEDLKKKDEVPSSNVIFMESTTSGHKGSQLILPVMLLPLNISEKYRVSIVLPQ